MSGPFEMPIMSGMKRLGVIVFDATPERRKMADRNHGQTLERLKDRGGLCWTEFYCMMYNKHLSDVLHNKENQEKVRQHFLDDLKYTWMSAKDAP